MNCNCTNGCHLCGGEQVMRQVFNCPGSQRVVRHEHIVNHQHETVHEIDVVHCHEHTTRDVVRERQEVVHNDHRTHVPNYCGDAVPLSAPRMQCGGRCNTGRWTRRW
jgi:hypothetical protein